MKLFDALNKTVKSLPYKVLFEDDKVSLTATDIEIASGKVYGYLCSLGIGREDIVMIYFHRSANIAPIYYGIFKAGACSVVVDGDASKEYYDYYKSDTSPALIIDEALYGEILKREYVSGNKEPDCHDAAYIVYTSSSTGMPKGCVHEYGDIDRHFDYIENFYDMEDDEQEDRTGMASEFYDIATVSTLFDVAYYGNYVRVMGREVLRDKELYADQLEKHRITFAMIMPHLIDFERFKENKHLKSAYFSFEVVGDVFASNIKTFTLYGMSESASLIAMMKIDKEYEISPVGKPSKLVKPRLVDENNIEVKAGEIGEVAFKNPYFRGYLNKPEITKEAMRGGLFHTGDMGYIDSEGNIVIIGRKYDIEKTERGYVVPAFIEAKLKKEFGSNQTVMLVKKGEKLHIVLCYIGGKGISRQRAEELLVGKIEDYMMPTDYLEFDEFPALTAGKLDRKNLIKMIEERLK